MFDADCQVGRSKQRVHDNKGEADDHQESYPRGVDQVKVRMRITPCRTGASYVETSVRVDGTLKSTVVSLSESGVEAGLFRPWQAWHLPFQDPSICEKDEPPNLVTLSLMPRTESSPVALGTPAPSFALPDVISGKTITLDTFAEMHGLLVMFICRHCPFVKHIQLELPRLGNNYAASRSESWRSLRMMQSHIRTMRPTA